MPKMLLLKIIVVIHLLNLFGQAGGNSDLGRYGLWPGLISLESQRHGAFLPGMMQAIHKIWTIQHPVSCKHAKYLIYDGVGGGHGGFGFEFHAASAALATAVELGRIFLFAEFLTARYRNDFCRIRGYQTFDCYFEPMSNCTLADALAALKSELLAKEASKTGTWSGQENAKLEDAVDLHGVFLNWNTISEEVGSEKTGEDCHIHWRINFLNTVLNDGEIATNTSSFSRKTFDHIKNAIREVDFSEIDVSHHMFTETVLYSLNMDRFIVPSEFSRLRRGSGLNPANDIDWWRAISSAYIIRPNPDTLAFIEGLRDPVLRAKGGRCVSTYIRHGDKAVEMALIGFESYAVAALALFSNSTVFPDQPTGSERLLYLATEDVAVLDEADEWAERENITVRYSSILRDIIKANQSNLVAVEALLPENRQYEYMSFLLHLSEILHCDAYIGTPLSNFNRVIDELRMTVGFNAHGFSVDLHDRSCSPVCIRNYAAPNDPYAGGDAAATRPAFIYRQKRKRRP